LHLARKRQSSIAFIFGIGGDYSKERAEMDRIVGLLKAQGVPETVLENATARGKCTTPEELLHSFIKNGLEERLPETNTGRNLIEKDFYDCFNDLLKNEREFKLVCAGPDADISENANPRRVFASDYLAHENEGIFTINSTEYELFYEAIMNFDEKLNNRNAPEQVNKKDVYDLYQKTLAYVNHKQEQLNSDGKETFSNDLSQNRFTYAKGILKVLSDMIPIMEEHYKIWDEKIKEERSVDKILNNIIAHREKNLKPYEPKVSQKERERNAEKLSKISPREKEILDNRKKSDLEEIYEDEKEERFFDKNLRKEVNADKLMKDDLKVDKNVDKDLTEKDVMNYAFSDKVYGDDINGKIDDNVIDENDFLNGINNGNNTDKDFYKDGNDDFLNEKFTSKNEKDRLQAGYYDDNGNYVEYGENGEIIQDDLINEKLVNKLENSLSEQLKLIFTT
ncbi:MAG: hypothetical protein MJ072_04550, partial [Clostridia bacterium]|nr:hypothetical protein [Clostridia bacterium]